MIRRPPTAASLQPVRRTRVAGTRAGDGPTASGRSRGTDLSND